MSKTFIISKNEDIIQKINNVLNDYPAINVTDINSDADEAMNRILKQNPELIYLDLDSFELNPFYIVTELQNYLNNPPQFIALSKDKGKAYQAMKLNFIDFLLNPLSELEIRKSIIGFQQLYAQKKKNTLCLKSYKDYQYIDTQDILFLKADNNTCEFHLKDGNVINAYKTLKTFETRLPEHFLRIHKSYIVNTEYISRINYGKLNCTIKSHIKYTIPFTKTYTDNIALLKNMLSQYLVA